MKRSKDLNYFRPFLPFSKRVPYRQERREEMVFLLPAWPIFFSLCVCSVPAVHTASPVTAFAAWAASPAHVCSSKMASQALIPATVKTPRSLAQWLTPRTSCTCLSHLFVAGRRVPWARSILCEVQTSVSFPGCRTKCHPESHSYSFCNEVWCQSQARGGEAHLWMLSSIPKMPFASPPPHD